MGIRQEKNLYNPETEITNEQLMEELKASREENARILELLEQALAPKTSKAKRS